VRTVPIMKMKITLAAVLSFAALCALSCIEAVQEIEGDTISELRNIYWNLPEDEAIIHHAATSESEALEAVEGFLAEDTYAYANEANEQRKLMMGSSSSGKMMRYYYYAAGRERRRRGYYAGRGKGKGHLGTRGKGKGKGKGKGRHNHKGKGKGKPKPHPAPAPVPVPAPVPAPTPTLVPFGINCSTIDPDAVRLTCDFKRLTVNVSLDDLNQLRILREDCGILNITAIKNGVVREVNVKDDPNTALGNLVFIKGPPRNDGNGRGGCLTFEFNRIVGGTDRKGVVLTNMFVNGIDAVSTVQVSRGFVFLFNVSIAT
jgi:hypothetical protein